MTSSRSQIEMAVAALGIFMVFLDATVVNVAFSSIAADFHGVQITTLQWVINAYNVVFATFLVAGGRIADRIGRRRVFLSGLAVFTGASALCSLAPTPATLVAARALQALGAAAVVPSSLALVLAAFPPERRGRAVAGWSAIAALAAGLGPLLGGLLITAGSWRLVFLVNVPVGVLALLLGRSLLRESRSARRTGEEDLLGGALLALAVAAGVLAIVQGGTWGWASPGELAAAITGLTCGVLYARRMIRRTSAVPDPAAGRGAIVSNAATTLAAAGFYGYTLLHALFLTEVWHYPVLKTGLALTPAPILAAAAAGPAGRLAERFEPRVVVASGALIWGAGVSWFAFAAGPHPDFAGVWLPGVVLAGVGAGLTLPTLSGAAIAAMPGTDLGTASGVNGVARQLGAALGVAVVVATLGRPDTPLAAVTSFDHAWLVAALMLFAAGVVVLGLGGRSPAPGMRDHVLMPTTRKSALPFAEPAGG